MGQQGLPPGYRFSPTDEELVVYYLKNRACGRDFHQGVIAEVDIYKHDPWDLPDKSMLPNPDPVWYFFNAQDKKHSHTARINRTTGKGYWKATGKDRKICCGPHTVGVKKTLIYYEGRAPSGKRTDWIMHEYKLDEEFEKKSKAVCSIALCRIRKKGGPGPRNGEQYGASVFNEHNEWGEDLEEDVDEKLPILSDSKCEASVSSIPNQIKEPKEQRSMVLPDLRTEGCGSSDLSHSDGLDTNTELDLHTFLESFFTNDPEATSFEAEQVFPHPVLDKVSAGHQPFDCDTSTDLNGLLDIQSLLDFDGENVDDILHPISGEEQILEELLYFTEGSPLHVSNVECDGKIISQLPACSDSALAYNDGFVYGDDVGPRGIPGDFIELDDMNSPLEGFVIRSPWEGSYYSMQEEQEPQFALFSGVEDFGGSSDLLHAQGSAARRARLQIAPPSVTRVHAKVQEQIDAMSNLHPKVQYGESSSAKIIQKVSGNPSQNITILSSGSGSDSEEVSNVVKSLPKSLMHKHMSLCMITKCEVVPPQVFFTTTTGPQDEESSINDSKVTLHVGVVPSRQQNISSGMQDASPDCEAGAELRSGSISENPNTNSCILGAGIDCEAGLNPTVERGLESTHLVTTSAHGNSVIGDLVSKVKALTLGKGLAQLDSNLSTTFNDKVFALGKPVAQLVPSKDYVNPYRSLRRGAMTSLYQLAIAVVFLFFVFLGIHMLAKYVLSWAART